MSEQKRPSDIASSAILDDGSIVEMLYRRDQRRTTFAVHTPDGCREHSTVQTAGGNRLRPYSAENNLIAHDVVLFPSAVGQARDTTHLIAAVREFIHRYADLSHAFAEIASHYVLLTWVYDAFRELPYLRLKGDFGTGKTRCLLTIGALCYKPMFVSGASTVSPMFRIIDAFRGTLVLDESDFRFSDEKAEVIKILNNGNAVGCPVLRSEITPTKEYNPRAFAVFGPKIVATRGDFDDNALESRCLTESLTGAPPREDIPLTLPPSFECEAEELRNALLAYRFHARRTLEPVRVPREAGLEPRVAQVISPLLAVATDDAVRERMLTYGRRLTSSIQTDREGSAEARILEVMLEMRRTQQPWLLKDIAQRFAVQFGADYERKISPRWIGARVRSWGVMPVKSNGNYWLPPETTAAVMEQCTRYGLPGEVSDLGT